MKLTQGFRLLNMTKVIVMLSLAVILSPGGRTPAFAQTGIMTTDNSNANGLDQTNAAHDIVISGWLRYSRHDQNNGAAFFSITNNGQENHLLTGVQSPVCAAISARHSEQQATAQTDVLFTHFALPKGITMVFPEGSYHLMCLKMKPNLQIGEKVPFTFTFLGGSSETVSFVVRDANKS